jgi:ADP-heptose:LPS heptosyltransferase/glycosyltransferase involved in cell wall biosynthesis
MASLTVTVITLNEEDTLPALLASIRGLADEVVIVDSGSTDRTVELARAAGARVVHNPWPGFAKQRRLATSLARNDWILSLDADERPASDLIEAIRSELSKPEAERCAAYRIHFRHQAFGVPARFGAMWNDRRIRLFDRRRGGYDEAPVHERIVVSGPVGNLRGRCDHRGYRTREEAKAKLARYAELSARERYRQSKRWRPWHVLRWPAGFLKRYLFRLGFLDGRAGLDLALLYARYDADKTRWLRRLDQEIGGAHGRGPAAEAVHGFGRRFTAALAELVWPRPKGQMPPLAEIRKVLVVRSDERIGNQLLTTPLLRALKLGLPSAQVHLLAAARQSQVVPSTHVDQLFPFEKRLAFRAPWKLFGLLRHLRREHYDVVVEAGHWSGSSLTASLLARLAGARAIVGHLRGDSYRFLSHPVIHDPANRGEVQAKLELLRPFGISPRGLEPESDLGRDMAPASALLAKMGVSPDAPLAVVNVGARMADRRWNPTSHAAVARGLRERGLAVLIVWGPGEEAIAQAVASGAGTFLAPATDLALLAGLLRRARICVSNNTGPMHLAVAVRTPTVGVFLAGDDERWGHSLPWFAGAKPASDADAETVLKACDRLLEQGQQPPRSTRSSPQEALGGRRDAISAAASFR